MYIPEKLKLNAFRLVAVPKPAEMFARFGYQTPSAAVFTGDDEVVSIVGRKTDVLADMDAYDRMMQQQEDSKLEASSNDHYEK